MIKCRSGERIGCIQFNEMIACEQSRKEIQESDFFTWNR